MKINSRHVRYMTVIACTSLVVGMGSAGITAHAATKSTALSGITAVTTTSNAKEDTAVDEGSSTAGVTLLVGNALADDVSATVAGNSASLVQTSTASYEDVAIAQVESYANIRALPDENAEVVGMIYNNCAASIIGSEGDWYKITSGNVTGFIKKEYLVIGNADLARSVSRREATVKVLAIDVFEDASEANSLGKFPQGTVFTVLEEGVKNGEWVKVTCENGDGYVVSSGVDITTKYALAETVAEAQARLAQEEAQRQAAAEAQARQAFAAAAQTAQKNKNNSSSKSSSSKSSSSGSGRSYSAPSGGGGSAVANYALQFVGNPYVYGGSSLTNGTDCSGFVMSVYAQFGVSLPHSSYSQENVGYSVSDMQAGDIVCYGSHVGICIGNGQIVHASNARDGIKVSDANYRSIVDIRRIY